MGILFSKIKEFFNKPDYEVSKCQGLTKCHKDMEEFYRSVNNENCPLHVKKIQNLIKCYNSYHPNDPLQIDITQNELTDLLTTEEDMRDLEKASNWLQEKIDVQTNPINEKEIEYFKPIRNESIHMKGGKSRKLRKSKKSRKSRKK